MQMMILLQEFSYNAIHVTVRTLFSAINIKFTTLSCDKNREFHLSENSLRISTNVRGKRRNVSTFVVHNRNKRNISMSRRKTTKFVFLGLVFMLIQH